MVFILSSASQPPRQFVYVAKSNGETFAIQLEKESSEFNWRIKVDDTAYQVITPSPAFYRRRLKLTINGEVHRFRLRYSGNFIEVAFCGLVRTFEIYHPREWESARYMPSPAAKQMDNVLQCPMPGLIVEVKIKPGYRVFRGQELVIMESMKMESAVASPRDGIVGSIDTKPGDAVETGMVLLTYKR